MTFQDILDDYRNRTIDEHVVNCRNQSSLSLAIYAAACSLDENNKIHRHQNRVGYEYSKAFALQLQEHEDEIRAADTFEEILKVVTKYKTYRVGQLALYDTAERIGAYLNKFPTKIYLHCGARDGAKNLLGNLQGKKMLNMSDLPQLWQDASLEPYQVENIFCIYKKHLHPDMS